MVFSQNLFHKWLISLFFPFLFFSQQGRTPLDIANDDPKENIIEFLKDPKKANEVSLLDYC